MSRFFIHRPIFAMVIALVIVIAGGVAIFSLPVAQYPQISPPTVTVETFYTGASAKVVEENVAIPIEQEVNGAENMLYMSSTSTSDGRYYLTCTFAVGTDLDIAQVDVQNRVSRAEKSLPPEVKSYGITTRKASPDMLLVLSLFSPDGTYDDLFLSNYARINLYDPIFRIYGVGNISIAGEREYAMRLWVRPDKLAKLGLTADRPHPAGWLHPAHPGRGPHRDGGQDLHFIFPAGRPALHYYDYLPASRRQRPGGGQQNPGLHERSQKALSPRPGIRDFLRQHPVCPGGP